MMCMIFGAMVPFVLRKAPEKWFELAGETYVHLIMDGEAMEMGLDKEDFCHFSFEPLKLNTLTCSILSL